MQIESLNQKCPTLDDSRPGHCGELRKAFRFNAIPKVEPIIPGHSLRKCE